MIKVLWTIFFDAVRALWSIDIMEKITQKNWDISAEYVQKNHKSININAVRVTLCLVFWYDVASDDCNIHPSQQSAQYWGQLATGLCETLK